MADDVSNKLKTNENGEDNQKSSRQRTLLHNPEIFLKVTRNQMDRIVKCISELDSVDNWTKTCKWLFPLSSGGALTCLLQFFCNGQKTAWIIAALFLIGWSVCFYFRQSKKNNKDENSIENLKSVILEISEYTPEYNPCFDNSGNGEVKPMGGKKSEGLTTVTVIIVSFLSLCVLSSCNITSLEESDDLLVLSIGIAITSFLVSFLGLTTSFIEKKKAKHYYDLIDRLKYNDTGDVDASKAFFILGNSMVSSGLVSDAIVYYTKAINETNDKPEYYEKRADAYRVMGSIKEAQIDYEKAIDLFKTENADRLQITQIMHELANLYLQTKEFEKAEQCFQNAIASFEENDKTLDKLQIGELVDVLNDYGNMLTNINKLKEAELIFNKASENCDRLIDGTEKSTASRAMTLNNMAILYKKTFQFEKAEKNYFEALDLYRQLVEKDGNVYIPDVAMTLNNLGNLHVTKFEYEKAERELEEALKLRRQLAEYEEDTYNVDVATTLNNLANLYKEVGKYDEAEKYYQESLSIREKVFDPEHPDIAATYNNIAGVYYAQGDYGKALEYYFKALAIREKVFGIEHPDTAESYNNISSVYYTQGDYGKALEYISKALEIREKVLGAEHPDTAESYNNIGLLYHMQGDYEKALEYYFKALTIDEKTLGKEHPDTAADYNNIGGLYKGKGDYEKALEYYFKALAICEKVLGAEHPDTARLYHNISHLYYDQGDYHKALDYLNKAYRTFEKVLGPEHPNTKNTLVGIELVKKAM